MKKILVIASLAVVCLSSNVIAAPDLNQQTLSVAEKIATTYLLGYYKLPEKTAQTHPTAAIASTKNDVTLMVHIPQKACVVKLKRNPGAESPWLVESHQCGAEI